MDDHGGDAGRVCEPSGCPEAAGKSASTSVSTQNGVSNLDPVEGPDSD
jgi:hypothetical protein